MTKSTPDVVNPDIPVGGHEIFTPPHPIAGKVTRKAGSAQHMIEQAEAMVQTLAGAFEASVADECERMRALVKADWSDSARRPQATEALHKCAHDLKGQGTTFNYPLITLIADSFCRYLRQIPAERHDAEVMEAFVGALTAVVHQRVKGDGGRVGSELIAGLRQIVTRSLG